MSNKRKMFCEMNPFFYNLSIKKEVVKRYIKNCFCRDKIAKDKLSEKLPNVVHFHRSNMIKRAPGVDLTHQLNKADNIDIAGKKISGIVIHPGEVFSFWQTVGKITKRKGYKIGRVLKYNKLVADIGGGLCNLGNTIYLLAVHSPLKVTELHHHSDALAPDEGKRVPFSAGISVAYNYVDLKLENVTDQDVQILIWCEGEELCAELRSEKPFPVEYELVEEGHHFKKDEDGTYYRNSVIYRNHVDAETKKVIKKELIYNNHSRVMFDYSLIPQEFIMS